MTTRVLRLDAQANEERILAAASAALARDGAAATLKAIAQDAGVGIGTLYRRFPRRELLVEAVHREETARLAATAEDLLAELTPLDALIRWLTAYLDHLSARSGMAGSVKLLLTRDEGLGGLGVETRAVLVEACQRLLDAAADAGRVRRGIDPLDLLLALGGLALVAADEHDPSRRDRLLALLLVGVRA